LRKALAAAGTDDEDLRAELARDGQVLGLQSAEVARCLWRPVGDDTAGADEHVAVVAHPADHDVIVTVAGHDVGVGVVVLVELHGPVVGAERARGSGFRRDGKIAAVRERG